MRVQQRDTKMPESWNTLSVRRGWRNWVCAIGRRTGFCEDLKGALHLPGAYEEFIEKMGLVSSWWRDKRHQPENEMRKAWLHWRSSLSTVRRYTRLPGEVVQFPALEVWVHGWDCFEQEVRLQIPRGLSCACSSLIKSLLEASFCLFVLTPVVLLKQLLLHLLHRFIYEPVMKQKSRSFLF